MAKISTYPIDATPQLSDKVIGTDVSDNNITKNYTIGDIVSLTPPPTINPTKLLYGDASSVATNTTKLSYIAGGLGTVPEDTVVIDGTMSFTGTSTNDADSLDIGPNIDPTLSSSVLIGQNIGALGTAKTTNTVALGRSVENSDKTTEVIAIGQGLLQGPNATISNVIALGIETAAGSPGPFDNGIYIGSATLTSNAVTETNSIVIGHGAMQTALSSQNNIAIGRQVLKSVAANVSTSTIMGYQACENMAYGGGPQTVTQLTAIGHQVLATCGASSIEDNVVVGRDAGRNVLQGNAAVAAFNENVLLGPFAGTNLGTGTGQGVANNVAIGNQAAAFGASANAVAYSDNIYIGQQAGLNASGVGNIGIGQAAGASSNLGFYNTAVGVNALQSQTGGDFNVGIGNDALQQMTTATNNTALGKAAGSTVVGFSNTTNLGHNSQAQGDNEVVLGDNNVTTLRCNTNVISGLSDARDKKNIEELPLGLDFISKLKPSSWEWDRRDGTMEGKKDSGFIAQDIDSLLEECSASEFIPSLLDKTNPEKLAVAYGALVPILVKAIQELKAEVEACKSGK